MGITELSDISLYVMTPEYGASSQLEKIDMLDYADLIAVNKFEKRGALDAFRDVRKQVRRNREMWDAEDDALPVYGTVASRFADEGVNALYHQLLGKLRERFDGAWESQLPIPDTCFSRSSKDLIAKGRERYLGDVARAVRTYHSETDRLMHAARQVQHLDSAIALTEGTPAEPVLQEKRSTASAELDGETSATLAVSTAGPADEPR